MVVNMCSHITKSAGSIITKTSPVEVTDFDKALKIIKLVEDLEEDEDIEKVLQALK